MCGIFGIATDGSSGFTPRLLQNTINDLFKLSESRGKEAAGIAIYGPDTIQVYKDSVSATSLMRSEAYQALLRETFEKGMHTGNNRLTQPITIIGHSRLVTNGAMEIHENNQPVIKSGMVGIHNGIIVNDERLWKEFASLPRNYQIDTEVLLTLIRKFYREKGSLVEAFQAAFRALEGTASVAILFEELDALALATNNGSLYACHTGNTHIFASERHILGTLLKRPYLQKLLGQPEIQQIKPGFGLIINVSTLGVFPFTLDGTVPTVFPGFRNDHSRRVVDIAAARQAPKSAVPSLVAPAFVPESIHKRFTINTDDIQTLRRCTKCVLPETMPFIEFDEQGVCSYCRGYKPVEVRGLDALKAFLEPYRKTNGEPDCLITFSGGRDSSFGVHILKTVLNMHPITYTYDWGMVTDLGRRNQARLCGKLGLEHILVSADIARKRKNIYKNVTAWLKRPDLGTVPLFMAGDKQYFYYANKLRRQLGVEIIILCENLLETTNFKSGFCGVHPVFGTGHTYTLSISNKARLAFYYGKQYLSNPAYLNGSVIDTLGAFASYYIIPHNYLNLYNYIRWEEDKITSTLIHEYDWEVAADTKTTWRIGDGTASFYNYIYYMMAGFTENDTFRSNQIREGMLTRERAIELIYDENQPRFESIQWYCNTIGIDMEDALERISKAPKLYRR